MVLSSRVQSIRPNVPLAQQVVRRQPPAREPQQQALVHPARTPPRQAVRRQLPNRGRQQPPCAPCTALATASCATPMACPGAPATAPGVHWMASAKASCASPAAYPGVPTTAPRALCTSLAAAGCATSATYLPTGASDRCRRTLEIRCRYDCCASNHRRCRLR